MHIAVHSPASDVENGKDANDMVFVVFHNSEALLWYYIRLASPSIRKLGLDDTGIFPTPFNTKQYDARTWLSRDLRLL